jgi:repressor of nif and glnA expression
MGKRSVPRIDFVEPMILKILEMSKLPMTTLSINYHVNERTGKTINLKVIKNSLASLVSNKKISEGIDEESGIAYYRLNP